jgi:hypothetical protein
MPSGQPTLPWHATAFSPGFGESAALEVGLVSHEGIHPLHQKDIDWITADLNHRRNQTDYRFNYDEVLVLVIYRFCRWHARS